MSEKTALLEQRELVTDRTNQTEQKQSGVKRTPQGPLCAWHGLSITGLYRFLRLKPPIHWSRCLKIASFFPASIYNSVMNRIESLIYSRSVAKTELSEPPIFILGHWRSGTTLLHNLMFSDDHMMSCNLYEILYPDHFLLTESLVTKLTAPFLPKTRPMDNMPLNWTLPQEDETALLLSTPLLSPYLLLTHYATPEVFERFYDLKSASPAELVRWKESFLHFLKKLSYRYPHRRALLKSPTHTYRIPLLLEMFPDAKFIFISRDPYAVFQSSLHLRRTLFDENGLAPFNEEGLEELTLDVFKNCVDAYERDRHLIDPRRLCEVRYEDFVVDPLGGLKRIYEAIDLPDFDKLEAKLRPTMTEVREYKKNTFRYSDDVKRRVYNALKPFFKRYGYESGFADDGESESDAIPMNQSDTKDEKKSQGKSESSVKRFTA
ncbi:MAG: sulfotransferase [Planctomycetota bacterium]|nr:sulfotransferase [Planctomycetota bacterium]MDA1212848.1 sulfotransferase [Planctomycetota bacterium]